MSEGHLSNWEKERFVHLPREANPPARLKERVLARLKEEQLVKTKTGRQFYFRCAVLVAASVLFFVSGVYFERLVAPDTGIDDQYGFLLLLHEDKDFKPANPAEMFHEYRQWAQLTAARGVKIAGQELENEAVLVSAAGPSAMNENENRTTGYFLLNSESLEDAVRIAQGSPHLKYGGKIEVKAYRLR